MSGADFVGDCVEDIARARDRLDALRRIIELDVEMLDELDDKMRRFLADQL